MKSEDFDLTKIIRKNWRNLLRMSQKERNPKIIFFTDEIVQKYAERHRALQAAIALVGNYRAGIDIKNKEFRPRAIFKTEGGVNVDGKEIVIKRSDGVIRCYNDWNEKEENTPKIVKKVVEEILMIQPNGDVVDKLIEYVTKNTNLSREIALEKILRFTGNPYGGDPLRRLF